MKIGIFTDSHYSGKAVTCGRRFNNQSLRKIGEAYRHFEENGCDLVICLGDLIDTEDTVEKEVENLSEIAALIKASPLRTYCLMGNHDAFVLTPERFYAVLGLAPPENVTVDGKRLIFLDACYFKSGVHYAPGDSDWKDTYYPHTAALEKELAACDGPAYLFMHQDIDPAIREDHRLANADDLLSIIAKSGVVKAVFCGHYHPGQESVHQGVRYVTLPAMCEGEAAYWIFEV